MIEGVYKCKIPRQLLSELSRDAKLSYKILILLPDFVNCVPKRGIFQVVTLSSIKVTLENKIKKIEIGKYSK